MNPKSPLKHQQIVISYKPVLLFILIMLMILSLRPASLYAGTEPGEAVATQPETSMDQTRPADLPEEIPSDWWTAVQEQIRRSEYHITWQDETHLPDVAASYQAPNRTHNLRTYFTPTGPSVIPRVWAEGIETAPWHWALALTGWGLADQIRPASPAELVATDNRIEYRRGGLIEWYINDARGLEQGFTLAEKPAGQGGTLVLEMAIDGDLHPILADDQTVIFNRPDGTGALRYAGLYAYDAAGRSLASRFELAGTTLSIIVDAAGAAYPVTIDPLATSPNWQADSDQSDAYLGRAVNTAGDVNGDGYADVIVGVPEYDNSDVDQGRVLVYYGSAGGLGSNGTPTNADWVAQGDHGSGYFGHSVSTAGDVNGDGYADVIIGASGYDDGEAFEGWVFIYHGSATGLPTDGDADPTVVDPDDANWKTDSDQAHAYFGYSVGTAGDVNGDGYDEIIIGAYWYDNSENDEGLVYVYYGSATGLIPLMPWIAQSNQAGASFGYSVGTAGDVNGDGYDDVIIGAEGYTNGQGSEGGAFVYLGSSTGLPDPLPFFADPDDDVDLDEAAWQAESNQGSAHLGSSVSTAGDVNGDGYADIIVGAPDYDTTPSATPAYQDGLVMVWHGSASGLGADGTPANTDWQATSTSETFSAKWGCSVSTAGDVNGDGYADVIIGGYDFGWGIAAVYYGSATGLPGDGPDTQDTVVDPDEANWSRQGYQDGEEFGWSVGPAGDVNGDGYTDVIVGAPEYYEGSNYDKGRAYLYHGSAGGLSDEPLRTLESDKTDSYFGLAAGSAGDVNGDGYADVIVGATGYDNGEASEGAVFVYHGAADGLDSGPDWSAEGNQANANLGYSAGTAGDVNGDGYDDVIVGAPHYDNGEDNEGLALVWHGAAGGIHNGSTGVPSNADWKAQGNQAEAYLGQAVSTAGDVNGDGYADVIVGAPEYDNGQTGEGAAFVWHGSNSGLGSGGTPANANWRAESDQADAYFGWAVGSAGDVNADGYSDVIIGAQEYTNGQTNEGAAFVWHGAGGGLGENGTPANAVWMAESNQDTAYLGLAVGSAGDVNGDGYADVIVGAPEYDNGQTGEGAAFVWHGSGSGLGPNGNPANADWQAESNNFQAEFAGWVGTAGDVNGDGYADLVIGARYYTNGEASEGAAFAWHGSGSGLGPNGDPTNADWSQEGDQDLLLFGGATGSAGDVNGDGYADVIVGATGYANGQSDEGAAFIYYGNEGLGLNVRPRQMQTGSAKTIGRLGLSDSETAVQLHLLGRMPLGREEVKLAWQVTPLGKSFNDPATVSGVSASWTDTQTTGVNLSQTVTGLSANTPYHWRVRLVYKPGNRMGQPAGRWLTMPWNGWLEQDFRTAGSGGSGNNVYLPVVIRN